MDLDDAARRAADPGDGLSLLALRGAEGAVAGHGTYIREGPGRAEVAFAVADAWHGHGIATVLLAHLAAAAADEGIETFTATVLSENRRMLGVFHDSGFPVVSRRAEGEIEIELPTSLSPAARQRFEERQRTADVAAVAHVLRPSSVAVIGDAEAVQPRAGFAALHRVDDARGARRRRGRRRARGDRRRARRGPRRRARLRRQGRARARRADARASRTSTSCSPSAAPRACGWSAPTRLGVACPAIGFDATSAPVAPPPGGIGFASQSGGFGIAAIDEAAARGLGFSSFVSMGDKADLSGNDFMEYWEQDAGTSVLLLYLESFGNPRRFGRIARRITRAKPIVAVKGARTAPAAASHTGALLAAADVTVDALFAHAGVLRAETVGEMFDVAGLLARQPLPRGDRVAVLTNAGGPGVACVDACAAAGLRAADPVDLTAAATAADYERSLRALLAGDDADAVVTVFVRSPAAGAGRGRPRHRRGGDGAGRPVLSVWLGADAPARGRRSRFDTPEEAVRALAHAVRHARRRAAPPDPPFEPADADTTTAATLIAAGLGRGGGRLAPGDVERLLRCWGIPVVASRLVASARAAGRAAAELGGPVALKAVVPGLVRKSDAGAVRLGLTGPTAVNRAAREMARALEGAGTPAEGFHVQRMAPAGTELIVGAVGDPAFGPLVACGAGGLAVELLGDVEVRLAPLGPREADGMLRALKTFPLLDGYRGRPPADLDSLRDLVLRVGALAATHPAVAELDLDPVIATPEGALVVDARVRLEAPGPAAAFPSLNV